jgi:hypothetical protein
MILKAEYPYPANQSENLEGDFCVLLGTMIL